MKAYNELKTPKERKDTLEEYTRDLEKMKKDDPNLKDPRTQVLANFVASRLAMMPPDAALSIARNGPRRDARPPEPASAEGAKPASEWRRLPSRSSRESKSAHGAVRVSTTSGAPVSAWNQKYAARLHN